MEFFGVFNTTQEQNYAESCTYSCLVYLSIIQCVNRLIQVKKMSTNWLYNFLNITSGQIFDSVNYVMPYYFHSISSMTSTGFTYQESVGTMRQISQFICISTLKHVIWITFSMHTNVLEQVGGVSELCIYSGA